MDEDGFDRSATERSLQMLLDNVPDLIFFKDTACRFTWVNPAYASSVGLADPRDLIGKTDADFFPSAEAQAYLAAEHQLLTTGEALIGKPESRIGADGQTHWVLMNKVPLRDMDDNITGIVGIALGITDRTSFNDALERSEARFRTLVQNTLDIISILNASGTILYESPSVERVLGYTPEDMIGADSRALIHPDDLSPVSAAFDVALDDPTRTPTVEFRFRHKDGSWRWLQSTVTNLLDDRAVGGLVVNSRDITERKEIEAQLWHQAHHDSLTGLPNRVLFMHRLQQALDERGSSKVAVIFLDLDGFKVVNDSLGHEYGDRLLVAVAERLRSDLLAGDLLARFGGDEFTVLPDHVTEPSDATRMAERLQATLAAPFAVNGHTLVVSASLGIVLSSAELPTPTDLLRAADVALYRAKANGKGSRAVFDTTRDASALAQLDQEQDLRLALDRGELRLHYQPKMDLTTGGLVGVEALVRWQHPMSGLVPPAAFIGVAEETGLIVPLGAWVLGEACRQVMAWHEQFPADNMLELSVNVSPVQIRHPDLVGQVKGVLRETGFPPERLVLEITERGLVDATEATDRTVEALIALGVQLAIDDFGAYQAGLGYLRRWPMHILKLDQTLVNDLGQNERSRAIVAAVVALAKTLGMTVTGEGIETAEQLAKLRELGCDWGQGYTLAPPLPAEELVAFLEGGSVLTP